MTTESPRQNTWHKPTFYAAVVLLAGATIIGGVVALSAMTGVDWQPLSRTPDAQDRSVGIQPYALPPRTEKASEWPTSPARKQTYHGLPTSPAAALRAGRGSAATDAEGPPTRLPSGEFLAAVADGRKVFLANPRGNCDLVGAQGTMTQAMDDCFAGNQAGR